MKQTICVLGGTGFIGKRLLLKLIDAGFNVNVITRHKKRHIALDNYSNIKLIEANLHTHKNLVQIFEQCDVLINLIGVINSNKGQSSYKKAHVDIVRKVISVINQTNVKRIIQVSALNANSSVASSVYLQSKGEAENMFKVQTNTETRVTVLRPSLVFGENGGFVKPLSGILKRFHFLPLPYPNTKIAPIFVDDIATAITECISNVSTFDKSYDLSGDTIYSLQQMVEVINNAQVSGSIIMPLSKFWSRVMLNLPQKSFTADKYSFLRYDPEINKRISFMPDHQLKSFSVWAKESLRDVDCREKYSKYRQLASR